MLHHLLNLGLVLQKLREAGLKIKPSKCALFHKEVLYRGQRISREGIATDPAKVNAVKKWPVPTTVQELQRFLGLAGYYRRYVSNFATIARPLAVFGILKSRLISAPILVFPDFNKAFVLDTDESDF